MVLAAPIQTYAENSQLKWVIKESCGAGEKQMDLSLLKLHCEVGPGLILDNIRGYIRCLSNKYTHSLMKKGRLWQICQS
ncbi:hypothetical protein SAMN04487969_10672 [Paenibacillus algorifonticola]|uniref:Uncharacterized protein n=1 Tax=Paenibacillus algorifonticola TaxID=684063 RepID=A0A1I2D2Q7_9BACL|nr:hypothetical protein SAMN04487969_10672 [Paenibacillus algorifonticola]